MAAAGMAPAVVGRRARRPAAVVAVIQRADTNAPTATTERKRKAALVLDSAAASAVRLRQSAAVAMAARQAAGGLDSDCSRAGERAKAEERCVPSACGGEFRVLP